MAPLAIVLTTANLRGVSDFSTKPMEKNIPKMKNISLFLVSFDRIRKMHILLLLSICSDVYIYFEVEAETSGIDSSRWLETI